MSKLYKLEKAFKIATAYSKATVQRNGIKAFGWSGKKNFGDLLTSELFEKYGVTALNASAENASIVGVGSLIHILPKNYSGIILGSGCIDSQKYELPNAQFEILRGEFTRHSLGASKQIPLGDPGLLAKKLLTKTSPKKDYKVGLIPHYVDKNHPWTLNCQQQLGVDGIVIDVEDSANNVINQINQCEVIISSSLHGIIIADALAIPNVWVDISSKVVGGGFKFHDYNTAIDYEQNVVKVKPSTRISDLEHEISNKDALKIKQVAQNLDTAFKRVLTKFR